jgi:hypothetical protein
MVTLDSVHVELELDGDGGGWTDVTADVFLSARIKWRRGLTGSGPLDQVASPGRLVWSLNNSEANSARTLGYYTPGGAFCRAGFDVGIGVRLRAVYAGVSRTLFVGVLDEAVPAAGRYGGRGVSCVAFDWLEEAARFPLSDLSIQTDVRGDEVLSVIVASMPRQPQGGTSFEVGRSTFAYALDTARDESSRALGEFAKLAASEGGRIYTKADGTLRFESRVTRPATRTVSFSLADTMTALPGVSRRRSAILNSVQATVHPRRVDASVVTLYTLRTSTLIRAGESLPLFGGYVDPEQLASRVGGVSMVAPVPTTDYTFNSAEDGSGADLTSALMVVMSSGYLSGGNGFYATITNTGSADGYLTTFRTRGRGVYDYESSVLYADNSASASTYGQNGVALDLPYQNDPVAGNAIALYTLALFGDASRTYVPAVSFSANRDASHMLAALDSDISTRGEVSELVTAIDEGVFINGVEGEIGPRGSLSMTWTLAPADLEGIWIVGVSSIGGGDRVGY